MARSVYESFASSSVLFLAILLPILGLASACSAPSNHSSRRSVPTPSQQETEDIVDREGWSDTQASEHAARYNNPYAWLLERLADDVDHQNPMPDDQLALPFPYVAFPAPEYSLTGHAFHGLSVGPLELGEQAVGSYAGMNRPLDESALGPDEKLWEVVEIEPLFVIVAKGTAELKNQKQWAISRSHPHYLFQGTFVGAVGEIDWIAIRMAGGTELAVVNGRVFDLHQGNLILVQQHENGSIRLYQDLKRLDVGTWAALHVAVAEHLQLPQHAAFISNQ